MKHQDLLPRQFQCDCERLFERVIAPTLAALQPEQLSTVTEYSSVSEFLAASTTSTSNMLAYEARRSFALTLGGLFERQLRGRTLPRLMTSRISARCSGRPPRSMESI